MSLSIDRRHILTGLAATAVAPSFAISAAGSAEISSAMHVALGVFLEANGVYHQAYRALPTARMAVTPPALRDRWMSANVNLRRAAEAVISVRSRSAEDVRSKMQVVGVFFMKECPPESYWALSEAIRWNTVIDGEAAVFGVARPIGNPEFS